MPLATVSSKSDLPQDLDALRDHSWKLSLAYNLLSEKYQKLLRTLYGRKSEKLGDSQELDSIQMEMDELLAAGLVTEEQLAQKNEESIEVPAHKRRRSHPGRNAIPEELLEVVELDLGEKEKSCLCCGGNLAVVHTRTRTIVERIPAQYKATRFIIPEYGCPTCKGNGIVSPDVPIVTLPRTLAGPHLLSFVMLSKYLYHLPLYRIQRQIFHECGVWFTRSTLASWVRLVCSALTSIHKALLNQYRGSRIKHADETPVKVMVDGKLKECWMWVGLTGDGRTGVYRYDLHRSSKAAIRLLTGSSQGDYLMVDDCPSYNKAVKTLGLIVLHCLAHIRRKFYAAYKNGYGTALSLRVLIKIGQLYRIERLADRIEASFEKRHELRQKYSSRICQDIKSLLDNPPCKVVPQSDTGIAVAHFKKNWIEATRFLDSGDLPIDNNADERIVRPFTIGRNNWRQIGSEQGAEYMACLYTLVTTCKLNGIDPHEYLVDVIRRSAIRPPDTDLTDLTPVEWYKNKNGGELPPCTPLYPSKS